MQFIFHHLSSILYSTKVQRFHTDFSYGDAQMESTVYCFATKNPVIATITIDLMYDSLSNTYVPYFRADSTQL